MSKHLRRLWETDTSTPSTPSGRVGSRRTATPPPDGERSVRARTESIRPEPEDPMQDDRTLLDAARDTPDPALQ